MFTQPIISNKELEKSNAWNVSYVKVQECQQKKAGEFGKNSIAILYCTCEVTWFEGMFLIDTFHRTVCVREVL